MSGKSRRTITPQAESMDAPLLTGGDVAALGARYAIPIAELITSARRRRKFVNKPTKFSRVNLGTPVVRDMTRPSFALPTRAPAGSSLAEVVGGQKFADAFQKSQETQFEMQNEMQKRQQEAANIGIENQEEMMNAQIANQEAQFNRQVDLRLLGSDLTRKHRALDTLTSYLSNDPGQVIASQQARTLDRANTIATNRSAVDADGNPLYSPEEIQWAEKTIMGARYGRKMKTRFSHG